MRPISFLFFYLLYAGNTIAQPKWSIYLGEGQDSLFEKSDMMRNINGDYSFFEFAGYHTYRHELTNTSSDHTVDRPGLVLTAKSTDTYGMNAEAIFGKDNDTCLIVYKAGIDKVTHGRSAALSLFNLITTFSGSGTTTKQSAPYDEVEHVKVSGTIYPGNINFDYLYDKGNFDTYKISGSILYNGDTLHIEAANHFINRRGRIKKFKLSFLSGIILRGKAGIYAAIDKYNDPDIFYLSHQLKEEEKILLSAYMFIIGCFQ